MAVTTNFGWTKPTVFGDSGAWGTIANALYDAVDSAVWAIKTTADAALSRAGGTLTGRLDTKTATAAKSALGSVSGPVALNLANALYFTLTVGGAITLSVSNAPSVANTMFGVLLKITNGGSALVSWPAGTKWPAGSAPALTTAGVDIVALISDDGGATYQGFVVAKDLR